MDEPSGEEEEVSGIYVWPRFDSAAFQSVIEQAAARFVPGGTFHGSISFPGPPASKRSFSSPSAWLREVDETSSRASGSYSAINPARRLNVRWSAEDLTLSIEASGAPDDHGDLARQVVEGAAAALRLKKKEEHRAVMQRLPIAEPASWAGPLIAVAKGIVGPRAEFTGSWEDDDAVVHSTALESDWNRSCDLRRKWEVEWSGDGNVIRIDHWPASSDLRIEVESYDRALVAQHLAKLKAVPGCAPKVENQRLQGEFRRYFLQNEIDLAAYRKTLGILGSFVRPGSRFWGRVARDDAKTTRRGFGSFDDWTRALEDGLAAHDLAVTHVSWEGPERNVTFEVDHKRDLVSIDLQSVGGSDVPEAQAALEKELALTKASEDAYKYRRWGRTYEIEWADAKEFATALEVAFAQLFKGRRTAIRQATLHVGGGVEQVSSSSSFEAFLAELKQARNLSEIHLLADGPRGEFMGVHVDRDLKRLRLLAHVDLARFQTFADHLAKGLRRAKLREMDDADPDAPAGKAERKPWVVAVVTGLLAFVAAFSGSKAYEAMREAPELIIDSPRLHDGQADASPPTVLVSWTYKKPRVLGPAKLDGAHPAVIEVTGEPAGQVVYSHRDPGRAQIPILTAGRYLVRITTDGAYRSFELNVMAPPEKAPAPPRGGSTPPPRGPKKPRGAAPQASTSPELGD